MGLFSIFFFLCALPFWSNKGRLTESCLLPPRLELPSSPKQHLNELFLTKNPSLLTSELPQQPVFLFSPSIPFHPLSTDYSFEDNKLFSPKQTFQTLTHKMDSGGYQGGAGGRGCYNCMFALSILNLRLLSQRSPSKSRS